MTAPALLLAELASRVSADDGYLPNGRARGVDADGWRLLLAGLRRLAWLVTWDGEPIVEWPKTVDDVGGEDCPALQVRPSDRVLIRVFPSWGTDSVWFDFDMREMTTQADADALFAFVQMTGQAVSRPVDLSFEGADEMVFARYDPSNDKVWWTSATSV